jgi:hypothetical protein
MGTTSPDSSSLSWAAWWRREFAEENPQAVTEFLTDNAFLPSNMSKKRREPPVMVPRYEITPSEGAIAKKGIHRMNLFGISQD